MPGWVKHVVWAFILLLLLAKWRQVASFFAGFGAWLQRLTEVSQSRGHESLMPFLVFGILVLTATAFWAIYWRNQGGRKS